MKATKTIKTVAAVVVVLSICRLAPAATILLDEFGDGSLASNPDPTATGFEIFTRSTGTATETGGNARFTVTNNSAMRILISKDPLDPVGTTTTWSYTSFSNIGGRIFSVLAQDPAAGYFPGQGFGTPTDQIMVLINAPDRGDALQMVMYDGGVTSTFNSVSSFSSLLNYSNPFDVILDVTATGYTVSVEQGGSALTGLPLSGNWSDLGKSLSDVLDGGGDLRVGSGMQGNYYGNNVLLLDAITVEGIPEPATMSLLAIGGLAALIRRKRS